MGRIWSVPWTGTVTNAGGNTDLWEFTPGDDRPIKVRGIRLGQTSEVADAAEEGLRITIKRLRATVTSGSGGSAGVPEDVLEANGTPTFTSEVNNTTVATTTGDTEILDEIGWNIRNTPYETWMPDPSFAPTARQTEVIVIRLEDTVADDITFCGTVWIEEE